MKKLYYVTLAAITVLSVSCLDKLASNMLYQNKEANKIQVSEVPPAPLQRMDINNADGSMTNAWYYQSQSSRAPVLVYFHGNASNVQENYDSGFLNKLRVMNMHFIVFDYPQYGLSTGELNQKGVLQSGQGVIDFVKQKFPQSKIIMWGRSLGCAPATILAEANQSDISKLILTSPWDSFWKLAKFKSNFPDSACKSAAKGNEYLSEEAAVKITLPVMILHGDQDQTIPYQMGVNMFHAFSSADKELVTVVGGDHNNLLGEKEWGQIEEFIFE